MKKEMLINVRQEEECRIAIMEDGVLEELYVERTGHESYVGNIYKGRIVNIEPSIQAAFVDFGVGRNGFLHVSDVEPQYYRHKIENDRQGSQRGKSSAKHSDRLGDILDLPDVNDDNSRPEGSNRGRSRSGGATAAAQGRQEAASQAPSERRGRSGGASAGKSASKDSDEPPPVMPSAERRTEECDEDGLPNGGAETAARTDDSAAAGSDVPPSNLTEEYTESSSVTAEMDLAEAREEAMHEAERPRRGKGRGRNRRGNRTGTRPRPKPPIQEIFRRGQEVLVQVIKEGIGTKGPTLSTYISIPGRYLVLMPGLNRIGVSRKIVDEEQRRRLRNILSELQPPKGLGFIIRTAGVDRNKRELQRDLAYLTRLWKVVVRRIKRLKAPASIYQESDMITRTIRDIFTSEIDTIWVDEPKAFERAQEFLQIVMPRYAQRIKLYEDSEPLFYHYAIEEEIARIQQRRLPLPNGGSLVIDQTEALVAIDVNSGSFRVDNNAEETAFRVNLAAAKEIARQLRLRDLGGVIVNDFIDMREESHRREVERALREAVKRDRARTKILRMSAFGIIEMTRQRIRPSLRRSVYEECPACNGTGHVKTSESMSIEVMRLLQLASHRPNIARVQVRVAEPVAQYLLNRKRKAIAQLEDSGKMLVTVLGSAHAMPETLDIACYDSNGGEVKLLPPSDPPSRGKNRR